jgi:hypothetical protein
MEKWTDVKLAPVLIFAALAGCAKSPTVILTHLGADATVPPLALLRMTVTSVADPTRTSTGSERSIMPGADGGRTEPFGFPFDVAIGADASFAGAVTVTIEGLDWTTYAVLASGSTPAQVVAEQQTEASVTLTAAASP